MAIPCRDLAEVQQFYGDALGLRVARVMRDRVTLEFFGDQVVCHLMPEAIDEEPQLYPRHFGITFIERADFDRWHDRCRRAAVTFFVALRTRFRGRRDEHRFFVIRDPSNNLIEFKHYLDAECVY